VSILSQSDALTDSYFPSREITAAQDDLRGLCMTTQALSSADTTLISTALLSRAKAVQGDVDKLTSGNATLQMYIDNLTMQMAKRR
jgi:hypothetical protein